ncbi:MAG: RidA family protein [Deltaproteobacteria bacterium]|nr:RidA family protein [Deltaproteobacteria bacterium]
MPRGRETIVTSDAPRPIGPYSQAVRVGDLLFTSGQIGLPPTDARLVEGGASAEARQVLENLRAILAAAGASLADVVKTTVYVTDLRDFAEVNRVYATFFPGDAPARSTVQVAALPLGARVEIEAIAALPAHEGSPP